LLLLLFHFYCKVIFSPSSSCSSVSSHLNVVGIIGGSILLNLQRQLSPCCITKRYRHHKILILSQLGHIDAIASSMWQLGFVAILNSHFIISNCMFFGYRNKIDRFLFIYNKLNAKVFVFVGSSG